MIRISVVINYVCHGKLVCVSCGWPLIVWWHILIDEFYACCRCMLGCLVYILVDRLVFAAVDCLVAHSDRRVLCLLSLYAWLFGVHSCR